MGAWGAVVWAKLDVLLAADEVMTPQKDGKSVVENQFLESFLNWNYSNCNLFSFLKMILFLTLYRLFELNMVRDLTLVNTDVLY